MRLLRMLFAVGVFAAAGCAGPTQSPNSATEALNPEWVAQLVEQLENEPVGNPPQSIWRYEYDGQVVYYVPAQCCDMFSTLYDAQGTVLCAPDGGLDGRGDGGCPDFRDARTNETLIWQDPRPR